MRSRLTIVGFNIAIITFQVGILDRYPGGIKLAEMGSQVHLATDITLFIGLSFSFLSVIAFLSSSALDREGLCNPSFVLTGDLLMYIGFAHSVAGFFGPVSLLLGSLVTASPEPAMSMIIVHRGVQILGGITWFGTAYFGPIVSILRSHYNRRTQLIWFGVFVLLIISAAFLNTQAIKLEVLEAGNFSSSQTNLLIELIQPLRW